MSGRERERERERKSERERESARETGAQEVLIIRQHTATQHTATHCNTLQHTATHCNTLQPHYILQLFCRQKPECHDSFNVSCSMLQCNSMCVAVCRRAYSMCSSMLRVEIGIHQEIRLPFLATVCCMEENYTPNTHSLFEPQNYTFHDIFQSRPMYTSHVPYTRVKSNTHEQRPIYMNNVPYTRVTSHVNEACYI